MSLSRTLLSLLAIGFGVHAFGQCQITTNASRTTITCGQCVTLTAFGNGTGNIAFAEDFNTGAPVGWQFTQSATFNNPCSPGGVDGTPHLWMGNASPNPRTMATTPLDLSLGGYICFDLLFAVQGDNSPCEGPDEPQEGVYLQYSTNGGATWNTINYFDPQGGNNAQLTNWNNWCFTLPPGALTPNTQIRWHQDDVTSAEYDHWGIDNVEITLNDPNFGITWLHDGYSYGLGNPGGPNPTPVCPQETTTYTAIVTDGVTTCTDEITITVNEPVIILDAGLDETFCAGGCTTLSAEAYHLVSPASTPTFANNEFGVVTAGSASVNINVQGLNTTSLVDGSITQVCINGFQVAGGASPCLQFGGCPCNGAVIPFGQVCNLNTGSFTVTLTAPGGCEMILVPAGVSQNAYQNTCFVPVGGSLFGPGFPNGGVWDPQQPFSNLNGCDPNGVWTLTFSAPGAISIGLGTLTGWQITFDDPEITEPVNYTWSPTDEMFDEDTLTPTVCPSTTTTFVLTATDLAGCITVTDEVTITVENCCDLTVEAIDVVQPGCDGTGGEITVSEIINDFGTVLYSLNNGDAQTSPTFSDLGPGTYVVTVIDDNFCPVNNTVVLEAGAGVTIEELLLTQPSCGASDGAITVVATGSGLTFSFDNGTTFDASPSLANVPEGVYDILVVDANGCSSDTSVTLNSADGPVIDAVTTTDAVCGDPVGSITIAATGAVTYSVDGGTTFLTAPNFTDLEPGTYDVVVADAGGCTSSSTAVVGNVPGPVINSVVVLDPQCGAADGTITLDVTGTGLSFSLDGGAPQTSNTFGDLPQGDYAITITDANGCLAQSFITLQTSDGPSITSVTTQITPCGLDQGSITVVATGSGLTYSVDGGASFQATGSFNALAPGSYGVVVTDDAGCSATATAAVEEEAAPVINGITVLNTTCGVADGSLSISANGTGLTYSIDAGTTTGPSSIFNDLAAGTYTIVVAQDGCSVQEDVILMEGAGPAITTVLAIAPTCAGASDGSLTVVASGGGALSYVLNGGSAQADPQFSGLNAGAYVVEVTSQPGGCATQTTVDLIAPLPLLFELSTQNPGCAGDCTGSGFITISGGTTPYNIAWTGTAGALGSGTSLTSLCAGSYAVAITDANGCAGGTPFVLTAPAPFLISNTSVSSETCPGACDGTILVAANGLAGIRLNGGPLIAGGSTFGLCPGTYAVEAVDGNGCTASTQAVVDPGSPVEAGFTATPSRTTVLNTLVTFTNTSVGAVSNLWNFGGLGTSTAVSPVYRFPEMSDTLSVCLTVTNAAGCTDTECAILIIDPIADLFVPNAFTPDNDGINDVFLAVGDRALGRNFKMTIFDRWGGEIFFSNDMLKGWDGSVEGQPAQDGVYAWVIEVQDPLNAEIRRYMGHVVMFR